MTKLKILTTKVNDGKRKKLLDHNREKSLKKQNISNQKKAKNKIVLKMEKIQKDGNITDDDVNLNVEDNDDNNIRKPTYYELKECEKPENTLNIVTVRKKKKQKHQQNTERIEKKSLEKEIKKNHDYLLNWKNNRDKWRFEKLRQISIQSSIFNVEKMSNDLWPIALEYLSGTKGSSKNNLIQLAEKQITELDNEFERTKNNAIFNDDRYKRAKTLLQIM